jgi:hypothetical protein
VGLVEVAEMIAEPVAADGEDAVEQAVILDLLAGQAEWQTRYLPAAIDQMLTETNNCAHTSPARARIAAAPDLDPHDDQVVELVAPDSSVGAVDAPAPASA